MNIGKPVRILTVEPVTLPEGPVHVPEPMPQPEPVQVLVPAGKEK